MGTETATAQRSGSRRVSFALLLLVVAGAPAVASVLSPSGAARPSAGGYPWPVRPFDRPHAVRGNFGDPRTIFHGPPTVAGLHGGGRFLFHRGVDISAENGTAVYPVASGRVTQITDECVDVLADDGRIFEYWHVRASVRVGGRVEQSRTLLGRVKAPAAHVHLTEIRQGRAVNPLQPGHLTPYSDTRRPRVTSIAFRRSERGRDLLPNAVRGRVLVVVAAEDVPTMPALRHWRGLPVTPALVTWRIERWDGRVVARERVAVDFRGAEPPPDAFWRTYARGTYQNMAAFRNHYSWGQRGSYVFKLSPRSLDTGRLRDGVYDLVATAVDIRGNRGSLSYRFTVANGRRRG